MDVTSLHGSGYETSLIFHVYCFVSENPNIGKYTSCRDPVRVRGLEALLDTQWVRKPVKFR